MIGQLDLRFIGIEGTHCYHLLVLAQRANILILTEWVRGTIYMP